ncbi:hypothetical protein M404DRAFT_448646 [Pisolithus tinctorius Marx 270]|uniref:Uncharacterized protein n=1 Tax=Pisolithus tinctorius Marx 270 TaxID=870435 RepID=A0A0C3KWL0_PISTI|nr:hypothetical protein M404DRAFT_448646 [Pisolithus tinctorius Marx 270]
MLMLRTAESHVVQLVCIGETRIRVVFAKTRVVIQPTAWSPGARIQSFHDSMCSFDRLRAVGPAPFSHHP